MFLTTLTATGTALQQSTYLGGSLSDFGYSLALDRAGNSYVAGYTQSADFPVVGSMSSTLAGSTDVFVARSRELLHSSGVYDQLGNLLTKDGVAYSYNANDNLQSGGGRTYAWNADNQPVSITSEGVQETYAYDADGQRVKRTRGTTTIVYLGGGVVEEETSGGTRTLYQFGGQVLAQRSTADGVLYFHSDHLGSVSVVTSASGSVVSSQEFTPWGEVRSGGIGQTSVNYTGQRRDGTGLLFYQLCRHDLASCWHFVRGQLATLDEVLPLHDPLTGIQLEQANRGSSSGSQSNEPSLLHSEVLSPVLCARIEEERKCTRIGVEGP